MSLRLLTAGALLVAVTALLVGSLAGLVTPVWFSGDLGILYVVILTGMFTTLMLTFVGLLGRPKP